MGTAISITFCWQYHLYWWNEPYIQAASQPLPPGLLTENLGRPVNILDKPHNLYYTALLHADIYTEVCTCSSSRCTIYWIFQQPILIELCFEFLNILPGAYEYVCIMKIYLHWKMFYTFLVTDSVSCMVEVKIHYFPALISCFVL